MNLSVPRVSLRPLTGLFGIGLWTLSFVSSNGTSCVLFVNSQFFLAFRPSWLLFLSYSPVPPKGYAPWSGDFQIWLSHRFDLDYLGPLVEELATMPAVVAAACACWRGIYWVMACVMAWATACSTMFCLSTIVNFCCICSCSGSAFLLGPTFFLGIPTTLMVTRFFVCWAYCSWCNDVEESPSMWELLLVVTIFVREKVWTL